MKNIKFLINLTSLLLCITLFAVGCKSEKSVSSESETTSSAPMVSSNEVQSSEDNKSDYDDLLGTMSVSGKQLIAYGDLREDEYSAALSELETVLSGYTRNISFAAYTLDNRKAVGYNTDAEIFCACTVKAAYSYYCCLQMDKGNGSLETQMTYEQKHYESGTGDMQYSPYGTVFDMSTIITKSMGISDNVGYLMQVDFFGRDGYNAWISSLGCDSLQIKPTVWSLKANARDHLVIWREIYNYFLSDAPHSEFLYNTCTGTAGNFATAALSGVEYSHKQGHNRSGEWTSYSDAGIVWNGNTPYIIAIITDAPGPSSYDADIFAQISTIVNNKLF